MVTDIMNSLTNVEGMAQGALNMTDDLENQLASFDDIASVLTDMDSAALLAEIQSLQSELTTVDFASMANNPQITGLNDQLAGFVNQPWRADIGALDTELGAVVTIPTELRDSLDALETESVQLASILDNFINQVTNWETAGTPVQTFDAGPVSTALSGARTSLTGLDAINDLYTTLTPVSAMVVPDSAATVSELDTVKSGISLGVTGLGSVVSQVTAAETQLNSALSVTTGLNTQWAGITGNLAVITPVLDSAGSGLDTLDSALTVLPPDSVEMLGGFRDLIGQVVKVQKNLDANVTSIKKFINDGREAVVAARNDFPPYRLFHGETNYTLPDLSASDYSMESVLNMTSECESHECFQAAVQYLDDNFVDLVYHVGAAQLDMDTSMEISMGREQLFVALYALTAIAGVLGIAGTCIAGNTGGAAADASKSSRLCHCTGLIFRMFSTWVLTIMAMFFLLLAALLMPSSILLSDMCGGLESTIIACPRPPGAVKRP
jgi:hypothetical protein